MNETMLGAVLPGNSTVELRDFPIPEPGHGQVLIKTKSSTICGSDIRASGMPQREAYSPSVMRKIIRQKVRKINCKISAGFW
jgi:threonine dehydrogenase-like Zn-dependent dehydrogenase